MLISKQRFNFNISGVAATFGWLSVIIPVLFRSMAQNVHMYLYLMYNETKRLSLITNATTGYHVIKKILISMLVITITIQRIQIREVCMCAFRWQQ